MMPQIIGIGIDATDISRISNAIERYGDRFLHRVFTDGEIAYCTRRRNPVPHLAARFAAKEAAVKALGAPAGYRFHDCEVVAAADGRPSLRVTGVLADAAGALGVRAWHVSLTHDAGIAAAIVVAEGS